MTSQEFRKGGVARHTVCACVLGICGSGSVTDNRAEGVQGMPELEGYEGRCTSGDCLKHFL